MSKPLIQPVGMWVTPTTQEELQERVAALHPDAVHAMMFTWNYLAYVLKDVLEEDFEQCDT